MIIAIHQPNYLPYLGFFDKMKKSDIFVIHDDSQFSRQDFHHRNRIRTDQGWQWLTVPVNKKEIPINEIKIKNEFGRGGKPDWSYAHFMVIRNNYVKTPYYKTHEDWLRKIYEGGYEKLMDLNMTLIRFLIKTFDIDIKIVYSSNFGFKSRSTQKIIDTVEKLGGDTYLSGSGGKNYMDISLLKKSGIKLEFQDFKHPVYRQRYKGFEPNMAAIDALFNVGKMPE